MSENNSTFRVEWPSGHVEVSVGAFFGNASNTRKVDRFLKLAKCYSSDSDKEALLSSMLHEKQIRTELISTLSLARIEQEKLLRPFFSSGVKLMPSPYENELVHQCDRISKNIEKVKAMSWEAEY